MSVAWQWQRRVLYVATMIIACIIILIFCFFNPPNPCNDFEDYATGGLNANKTGRANLQVKFRFETLQKLLSLLVENTPKLGYKYLDDTSSEVSEIPLICLNFFYFCNDKDRIIKDNYSTLWKFLDSIGDWPLANKTWKNNNKTIFELLGSIEGKGLPNGLFSVFPLANIMNEPKMLKTFYIGSGSLLLRSRYVSDSDMELFLKDLGIDNTSIIQQKELYKFQLAIKKIQEKYSINYLQETFKHSTAVSFENLLATTKCNWTSYFESSLRQTDIDYSVLKFFLQPGYIEEVCKVLANTPVRTVTNYAIWSALKDLYQHVGFYLKRSKRRPNTDDKFTQRAWECLSFEIDLLRYPLTSLFLNLVVNQKEVTKIRVMVEEIQETIMTDLKNSKLLASNNKEALIKKFERMKINFGFPQWITDKQLLNSYYRDIKMTENHLNNVLQLREFRYLSSFKILTNGTNWTLSTFKILAAYIPGRNTLEVPILLTALLDRFALAYRYAILGFLIARELVHVFDDIGIQFDEKGFYNCSLDKNAIDLLRQRRECIVDQYSFLCFQGICQGKFANFTVREDFADVFGFKFSYMTFQKLYKLQPKSYKEVGTRRLGMKQDKVFFYYFAVGLDFVWKKTNHLKLQKEISYNFYKFRINGPLQNSKEFSEVFFCRNRHEMNKPDKCTLW